MAATTDLPSDTSASAREALALLEPFFKAWRDSDPEAMVNRVADGKVDYIDYCMVPVAIAFCPHRQCYSHQNRVRLPKKLPTDVMVLVSSPNKLESREAVRQFLTQFFQMASDFTYTTVAAYGDRCQLTLEAVISFKLQAELPGFPLKKGDTATLPGVTIFKLDEEGLVVFKHDYFLLSHDQ
ncbi:hypothetical protein PG993_011935 [Apiospora rasikravindrae]|uniref:SnoaL-like domain-containing protein n=1 Tax=Apiospora rasikravindrae TaxID=990691 RepID=A0ABR1S3A7_9PEZI